MKKMALVLGLVLMNSLAFGNVLTLEGEDKTIENVKIAKSGVIENNGQKLAVNLVGAGLRSKKVLIANVKVYVAQLLASDPTKFIRTESEALHSLENMQGVAIQMHFLRTVDAEKVQVSFQDALIANQADLKSPSIKAFLNAVAKGGDAIEGKNLTIVALKNSDGTESVIYENSVGQVQKITGPVGLNTQVLSIWMGKAADAGVQDLKTQILNYSK
ncbi:MAG: chalcone isomerase family protein [Bdellovibrio sp.]